MKIHLSLIVLLTLFFSIDINAQQIIRENKTETAMLLTTAEKSSDVEKTSDNAAAPTPQATPYVRPTSKVRFRRYASDTFGVPAVIGSGIGAGFNQISNGPPEWKRTIGGFGRRFASNYGEGAIRKTVSYGLNEIFKLDNRFEKSGKKNIGSRIKHVFVSSFTTRTKNGKRIPDFSYAVGTYTANIAAAEIWYPNRYSYKDGLREGTISFGTRVGVNLLREFLFPK